MESICSSLDASCGSVVGSEARCETCNTQNVAALWEWQHQRGWLPFDAPLCNTLERAWASGQTVCRVSVGGDQYDINFVYMWQQNCLTHTTRPIRRRTLKDAPAWYWWNRDGCHRCAGPLLPAQFCWFEGPAPVRVLRLSQGCHDPSASG